MKNRAIVTSTTIVSAFTALMSANSLANIQIYEPTTNNGNYTLLLNAGVDEIHLEEKYELDSGWQSIYKGPSTEKSFKKKFAGNYEYRATVCIRPEPGFDGYCFSSSTLNVEVVKNNKPSTAVVLGDSFSSGEGGRWRGNSLENNASYGATDGAWDQSYAKDRDLERVYEPESIENGCHRAYTAPIHHLTNTPLSGAIEGHSITDRSGYPTLQKQVTETVNLACSGARTKHIIPVSEGGNSFKQESPQLTQLQWLNRSNDIQLIVLGAGGNDMGFGKVVRTCVLAWATSLGIHPITKEAITEPACIYEVNNAISGLPDVKENVRQTIRSIKTMMASEGKTVNSDYKIVLPSYPSIIPTGGDFRYSEAMRGNHTLINPWVQGQCPFTDDVATKISQDLMPAINETYKQVAKEEGVDFIDVVNALAGNRLCEFGTSRDLTAGSRTEQEAYAEYVRFLDVDSFDYDKLFDEAGKILTFQWLWKPADFWRDTKKNFNIHQGSISESVHLNQLGQKAIGWCLRDWSEHRSPFFSTAFECTRGYRGQIDDVTIMNKREQKITALAAVVLI